MKYRPLKKISTQSDKINFFIHLAFWLITILVLISFIFSISSLIYVILVLFFVVILILIVIRMIAVFTPPIREYPKFDYNYKPFVSIHIACSSEPAELVNQTLKRMDNLDYPKSRYEVMVLDNNNKRKENWQKIKKSCEELDGNFNFMHIDQVDGFKAGALNYLRQQIHKDTEIVAVVDSDYLVEPDFLKKTVGYFANPSVGIVQAPQDYYNVTRNNRGLFLEYRSFFAILINQAQALNAVTFTGTMGLIRSSLFKQNLAWNEWCITEDTEAGIFINNIGYRGIYVDHSYGKGLMPYSFASMSKQRQRWTFGNMQILSKNFFPILNNKSLTIRQKVSFLTQITAWFHFELVIATSYLLLSLGNALGFSDKNITILGNDILLGILAVTFLGNLIYFMVGLRKEASLLDRFKAFLTNCGLIFVMSASWLNCLAGKKLGFKVTKKEKTNLSIFPKEYWQEFLIPVILLIGLTLNILFIHPTIIPIIIILIFVAIEVWGILYLNYELKSSS